MALNVGLTYNIRTQYRIQPGQPKDMYAEFDHPLTIGVIAKCIQKAGHKVVMIGDANDLLKKIKKLGVDIVFNIAEGFVGRNRESQIPLILEMNNIAFVGSDALTLGLSLDKFLLKKILVSENIPTPKFFQIDNISQLNGSARDFPLIVKPRYEGSSKGISKSSVVKSEKELLRQVSWVIDTYKQPALVEEFIKGKEFTIAIIGNREPEVLPIVQISIDGRLELKDKFYTFSRIHSRSLNYICPAKIDKGLEEKLKNIALRTYLAIECRDFGRVDIRVDEDKNPYVLEINPLPSLSTDDVFMVIAKYMGLKFSNMINKILNQAIERHGKTQ